MKKVLSKGFTLLETLFVVTIIAGILIFSVNQYRAYGRQVDVAAVKSDVTLIRQALNRYYHIQGCHTNGTFAGNLTPSITDLGLPATDEYREPIVPASGDGYRARIIDTGAKTKNKKPIYRLAVTAELPTAFTAEQVAWYAGVLHATQTVDTTTLQWSHLPNVDDTQANQDTWILNGQRAQFSEVEEQKQTTDGGYNCAN